MPLASATQQSVHTARSHWRSNVVASIRVPREYHVTGDEHGLQGRYVQHVGNMLGPIFEELKLDIRMAEHQAGVHVDTGPSKWEEGIELGMRQPDLVMIGARDGVIRVVGEMKTYWTFYPGQGQSNKKTVQELCKIETSASCGFHVYICPLGDEGWTVNTLKQLCLNGRERAGRLASSSRTEPRTARCY